MRIEFGSSIIFSAFIISAVARILLKSEILNFFQFNFVILDTYLSIQIFCSSMSIIVRISQATKQLVSRAMERVSGNYFFVRRVIEMKRTSVNYSP